MPQEKKIYNAQEFLDTFFPCEIHEIEKEKQIGKFNREMFKHANNIINKRLGVVRVPRKDNVNATGKERNNFKNI